MLEPKLKALHSLYQTVLSEKGINFEETSLEYGGIKLPALKLAPGTSSNKLNKFKSKKDVLNLLEIKSYQDRLIESEKYWFIKWNDFDFGMELQAKKSQEVY